MMQKFRPPFWLIFFGIILLLNFPTILFIVLVVGFVGFVIYTINASRPAGKQPINDLVNDLFNKSRQGKTIDITPAKTHFSFSFPDMSNANIFKSLTGVLLVLALLLIIVDGLVNVPAGHVAVIADKGRGVLPEELPVGLHFKIPFWQTVVIMDTRLQVYTMSIASAEGNRIGDDSIEALTKDGQRVNIDLTVQYLIDTKKADRIYDEIGSLIQVKEKIIRPPVRNVVREVITGYESKQLFDNNARQQISQKIEESLRTIYAKRYIVLEKTLLRNVRFSNIYLNAIEEKQVAEQKIQKAEFEKQEAEIKKQKTIIEAEAEAAAIKLKGDALREAPQVIQLRFVEKMAPQISWGILPDGALPLIDIAKMQK